MTKHTETKPLKKAPRTKCFPGASDPDEEDASFFEGLAKSCDEGEDRKASILQELKSLHEQLVTANRAAAVVRGKLFGEGEAEDKKEGNTSNVDSLIYNCRIEAADFLKQLTSINKRL